MLEHFHNEVLLAQRMRRTILLDRLRNGERVNLTYRTDDTADWRCRKTIMEDPQHSADVKESREDRLCSQ